MRRLVYTLTNGKVVGTLREAQMSGQGYKQTMAEVEETPIKLTEKQAARRVKI